LARHGYCAALKRWFHGVREHLIFTPQGRIAFVQQVPGHRHDTQGLYALLETSFSGALLGDNAYWPRPEKRTALEQQQLYVTAATRSNWNYQHPPAIAATLRKHRPPVERRIAKFNKQFHAQRTLCRSRKHYEARRWAKALTFNASRPINLDLSRSEETYLHFHIAA
jgi:hypothetical protein